MQTTASWSYHTFWSFLGAQTGWMHCRQSTERCQGRWRPSAPPTMRVRISVPVEKVGQRKGYSTGGSLMNSVGGPKPSNKQLGWGGAVHFVCGQEIQLYGSTFSLGG